MGFEPTTSAVTGRRSNQLSHQANPKVPKGLCLTGPSKLHTEEIYTSLFFPKDNSSLSFFGQVLDLLVSISYIHYCTSTFDLSTLSSSRGLTTFVGISHLEGGFTLRCLQRLSLPNLATLPCRWYDNRYTRGSSIPVLSY